VQVSTVAVKSRRFIAKLDYNAIIRDAIREIG
jgi:hypothetical protein